MLNLVSCNHPFQQSKPKLPRDSSFLFLFLCLLAAKRGVRWSMSPKKGSISSHSYPKVAITNTHFGQSMWLV